ncbi:MAG: hypothetical protein H6Q07_2550 [Acidobacteria bacterium]|jgi:hypothetical protein|nr:hypothetical protein [Acidobacteriota bacterium]
MMFFKKAVIYQYPHMIGKKTRQGFVRENAPANGVSPSPKVRRRPSEMPGIRLLSRTRK